MKNVPNLASKLEVRGKYLGNFSPHTGADVFPILYSQKFVRSEPEFLNVYGAQESIPRNEFGQPM